MNQQQQIAADVLLAADARERLARTWEASAQRYFRLAESLPSCSFARAKMSAHAVECQGFADALRDTYPQVKDFYLEVANDHIDIALKFRGSEYHALHHLNCADRALSIAESL